MIRLRDAESGKAVEGARVAIRQSIQRDGKVRTDPPIQAREVEPGAYSIRGFDGDEYDVHVTSTDVYPLLREGVRLPEELALWVHTGLTKRAAIAIVTAYALDGTPLAGVPIEALVQGSKRRILTGDDGVARFDSIPEGTHAFRIADLKAEEVDYSFMVERKVLLRAGWELEITLGKPRRSEKLTVDVRESTGLPCEGAIVELYGETQHEASSGVTGEAVLDSLAAGPCTLTLRRTRTSTEWVCERPVRVIAGEENRARIELGHATIRGRVVSQAAAGLVVIAQQDDWTAGVDLREGGDFEFADAKPGKLKVLTASDERGFVYRREVIVDVPESGDPPPIELRLEGLGVLWVEVKDSGGAPIAGATLECSGAAGKIQLPRRSTGEKAIEFGGLVEPGNYALRVSAPGRTDILRSLQVKAGERERVVMVGR